MNVKQRKAEAKSVWKQHLEQEPMLQRRARPGLLSAQVGVCWLRGLTKDERKAVDAALDRVLRVER